MKSTLDKSTQSCYDQTLDTIVVVSTNIPFLPAEKLNAHILLTNYQNQKIN